MSECGFDEYERCQSRWSDEITVYALWFDDGSIPDCTAPRRDWTLPRGWPSTYPVCSSTSFWRGYGSCSYLWASIGKSMVSILKFFSIVFTECASGWMCTHRAGGREAKEKEVNQIIRKKYKDLGPMSFAEGVTLFLFSICVALWFFRDPQFLPGWSKFFPLAWVSLLVPDLLPLLSSANLVCFNTQGSWWLDSSDGHRRPSLHHPGSTQILVLPTRSRWNQLSSYFKPN